MKTTSNWGSSDYTYTPEAWASRIESFLPVPADWRFSLVYLRQQFGTGDGSREAFYAGLEWLEKQGRAIPSQNPDWEGHNYLVN